MSLILEEYQPLLRLPMIAVIHLHGNHNGAGVNLIGLLHISQLAVSLQFSHCHQGKIHQADKLVLASCKDLLSGVQIALVGGLDGREVIALTELHIGQLRGEGGVTAVIGPIGIQNTDLRHGGVSLLLIVKVLLNVFEILKGHCQRKRIVQLLKLCLFHGDKAIKHGNICGFIKLCDQGIGLLAANLPGIHGVDTVCLDSGKFFVSNITQNHIGDSGANHRLFILFQESHALYCRVCSLIELTGQELYGKHSCILRNLNLLRIQIIHRGFGKYSSAGLFKHFIGDILHIIADEFSDSLHLNTEVVFDLLVKLSRFYRKGLLLFHIDTSDVTHFFPPNLRLYSQIF